jgi:hypothetical protein
LPLLNAAFYGTHLVFDSRAEPVLPVRSIISPPDGAALMAENNAVYAIRFPDGSVTLYIDEEYAIDRGIDPAKLVRVEIPREMFISGSIQQIREYVAVYLENSHQGTA